MPIVPIYISRDTLGLIRAVGGNDQGGDELFLSPFISMVYQAGPAQQVLPCAKIPTAMYEIQSGFVVGSTSFVEIQARSREVHLWWAQAQGTGPIGSGVAEWRWGDINESTFNANIVVATPRPWGITSPTAVVTSGTRAGGFVLNGIDAVSLDAVSERLVRIPRGRKIIIAATATGVSIGLHVVLSDIGPVERESG